MEENTAKGSLRTNHSDPADYVIEQIHGLIKDKKIRPGERLPSEKKLEETFSLPRGVINKALKRLETYGIVKTIPQSGTYIAEIEGETLEGLITNIVHVRKNDYEALASVRQELEMYAVELVTANASDDELKALEKLQKKLEKLILSGNYSFEEDMVFHLKIAAYTKDFILKSVLTSLSVDMIDQLNEFSSEIGQEKLQGRLQQAMEEHDAIIQAIKSRDPKQAREAMKNHFARARSFRKESFIPG